MKSFDPKEVAFAVITHYPKWYAGGLRSIKNTDKIRGDLAIEFIQKAIKGGYQIVVVDGESTKTFKAEINRFLPKTLINRRVKKRAPSKRQAIKLCAKLPGVKAIIMTEPEKISLITDCLPQIVKPIFEENADIVIPKRQDRLFKHTYPSYMYESEIEGNNLYNEHVKLAGLLPKHLEEMDSFFGPRVIKNDSKVLRLFMLQYKLQVGNHTIYEHLFSPEEYSNVQFFPIVQALRKKMRVVSIEVPFAYPSLQKENENIGERELFIQKRKNQKLSVLLDLMHFLTYFEDRKKSRLRILR